MAEDAVIEWISEISWEDELKEPEFNSKVVTRKALIKIGPKNRFK